MIGNLLHDPDGTAGLPLLKIVQILLDDGIDKTEIGFRQDPPGLPDNTLHGPPDFHRRPVPVVDGKFHKNQIRFPGKDIPIHPENSEKRTGSADGRVNPPERRIPVMIPQEFVAQDPPSVLFGNAAAEIGDRRAPRLHFLPEVGKSFANRKFPHAGLGSSPRRRSGHRHGTETEHRQHQTQTGFHCKRSFPAQSHPVGTKPFLKKNLLFIRRHPS